MELVHRAGSSLHWSKCACGMKHLELAHRSVWMRLFVQRRLFYCRKCRQHMLIPVPETRKAA